MVIHLEWRSHEWCITKPSSGRDVTGLYHKMHGEVPVSRRSNQLVACIYLRAAMDDEREGEAKCLFDLLTQSLFDSGVDTFPEVDQLFSQVLLPKDFEFEPSAAIVDEAPDSTGEKCLDRTLADAGPSGERFGPLVSESDISNLQKAAIPANTKKNTCGRSGPITESNEVLTIIRPIFSP